MDWKVALSSFIAVFVAELCDKTQLATFSLASGQNSKWSVLLGASLALVLTTVIAVVLGEWVGRMVPAHWIKRAAGCIFLVLGALYLSGKG